ncbi:unnamed protein product [Paramecium sonneborni]|uniref:Myb-like domain-containing protein n=1 Tax=Paramecium sonneborni TaxID=65129 RepID=A0A8S1RH48_9CILI|nr:unnamed protein product [Paramecium sonneborni]
MQSKDILAVQQNFLQTNFMLAYFQQTEISSEDVHEQLQLIESNETFNFDENEVQNDYYNPIQKVPQKKPRKRRRRQIIHDKRKKRASSKRINRKHEAIPFNYQEDRQILLQVLEQGPKFFKIAKSFPGRTLNMVKNRYYKTLRYKWDVILGQAYEYMNVQVGQIESKESKESVENLEQEYNEDIYSQFLF